MHVADRVLRAGRILGAGIHAATSVVARQIAGTVVVRAALDPLAVNLRIAVVARAAAAGRPVILAVAFRVDRALVLQDARIHALAVVTGGRVVALAVGFAVDCKKRSKLKRSIKGFSRRKLRTARARARVNLSPVPSLRRNRKTEGDAYA